MLDGGGGGEGLVCGWLEAGDEQALGGTQGLGDSTGMLLPMRTDPMFTRSASTLDFCKQDGRRSADLEIGRGGGGFVVRNDK